MGTVIGTPGEAMEELGSPYIIVVPAEPTELDRVLPDSSKFSSNIGPKVEVVNFRNISLVPLLRKLITSSLGRLLHAKFDGPFLYVALLLTIVLCFIS